MSCLYNSLTMLIGPDMVKMGIKHLRTFVCDFMEKNPELKFCDENMDKWIELIAKDKFNDFSDKKNDELKKRYIATMRQNMEWGGAPEISVVSYCFDVIIEVLDHRSMKVLSTFNCCKNKPKRTIQIKYTGSHYTPHITDKDFWKKI